MSPLSKKLSKIRVEVSLNELVSALDEMPPKDKEFFIENLLAATSPEYLKSIKEAREDYKKGRVYSHAEVFSG